MALEEMKNQKTDFAVSHWNMPVMTGIEPLKAIRADDALKNTAVLMVIAEAKLENSVEGVQDGVNSDIVKSFNAQTLQAKLNKFFP